MYSFLLSAAATFVNRNKGKKFFRARSANQNQTNLSWADGMTRLSIATQTSEQNNK